MACVAIRTGMEMPGDEGILPDAASVMLRTRQLNQWTNAAYTLDQVADMNWLTFTVLYATAQGMYPPKTEDKK